MSLKITVQDAVSEIGMTSFIHEYCRDVKVKYIETDEDEGEMTFEIKYEDLYGHVWDIPILYLDDKRCSCNSGFYIDLRSHDFARDDRPFDEVMFWTYLFLEAARMVDNGKL